MSKNGKKAPLSPTAAAVCQWHRDKAIWHWNAGRWDEYRRHARIADAITRKG